MSNLNDVIQKLEDAHQTNTDVIAALQAANDAIDKLLGQVGTKSPTDSGTLDKKIPDPLILTQVDYQGEHNA